MGHIHTSAASVLSKVMCTCLHMFSFLFFFVFTPVSTWVVQWQAMFQ